MTNRSSSVREKLYGKKHNGEKTVDNKRRSV